MTPLPENKHWLPSGHSGMASVPVQNAWQIPINSPSISVVFQHMLVASQLSVASTVPSYVHGSPTA